MKKIISSILVFAMLLTMVPVAFAATTNDLHLGATTIEGYVGETISVPVYLTGANNSNVTVPSGVTFRVSMPAGLTATLTAGSMPTDGYATVQSSKNRINVFYDGAAFTAEPNKPLFTINYVASATGEYDLAFSSVDFATLGVNAIGAKMVVTEPSAADNTNKLHLGAETINGKVGETIAVPVYLTGANNTNLTVPSGITFRISMPDGLSATLTDGTMATSGYATVQSSKKRINVFYDGAAFEADASKPLFTINYVASAAGEYDLTFSSVDFANVTVEAVGAKLVVEAAAPVVVLESIEVAPTAIAVPYANQNDVKAYVEGAITAVTGKYSDGSSAAVTGYTVAVDGTTATVTYEGKTATIALTMEPAPVVLTGIEVAPTTLTVPYANQADIKGYVESKITVVTAKYSDGTSAAVTGYTVAVDGTTATVTYEGKTATIALTLEEPPVVDNTNKLHLGAETINGKVGETVAVPVYLTGANNTNLTVPSGITFRISMPKGLTATLTDGTMTTEGYATVQASKSRINVFYDGAAFVADASKPLFTINYVASEAGEYDLEFSSVDFANLTVESVGAKLVVEAGVVVPDPEPSLVVNPLAITVPYGADVVEYIKANAKVYYYADINAEAADVTADAVITEDGVVTYNGLTANIAVTKVTLVDIVLSTLEKIVVPYGTADVKTYVEAEAAKIEVTAKYSNNTSAVVPATVEYAGNVVTISYDGIAKTVEVEEIKAVAIGVVPNTDIVVPYGSDVAEYIKTAVRVQVETSNGEKVAPLGEVAVVDNGDGTATVTADGCEATVTYTIGANPEDIASIEVTAGELVVPYGADAAAYIAANVTVTATKNSGATEVIGITAENVVPVDGVATITVEGCEATVNYTVETITGIEAAVEALDLAWDADVEAAVKAVAVYYVYSANTANSVVPAEDIAYEIKDTEAVITVGEYTATIALNIAAKPAYFVEEVAPAYDLDGHKALVITMNVDGVPYVNGVAAVKVAEAKFVFVTDEEYTIEVKEETADIVAWGTLHRDDMVTALDALMALNAADGVIADEFKADDNTYIKADIDLNYDITATDALGINNISLGKTTVVTMAE